MENTSKNKLVRINDVMIKPINISSLKFNVFPERILLPQVCEGRIPTIGGR